MHVAWLVPLASGLSCMYADPGGGTVTVFLFLDRMYLSHWQPNNLFSQGDQPWKPPLGTSLLYWEPATTRLMQEIEHSLVEQTFMNAVFGLLFIFANPEYVCEPLRRQGSAVLCLLLWVLARKEPTHAPDNDGQELGLLAPFSSYFTFLKLSDSDCGAERRDCNVSWDLSIAPSATGLCAINKLATCSWVCTTSSDKRDPSLFTFLFTTRLCYLMQNADSGAGSYQAGNC